MSPDFLRLKEYLIAATGLAYYDDRDADLAARADRSMARLGMRDYASYLAALEQGGLELDALIAELTIGETYFFRQSEQFDVLARLALPEILERNSASRRLRIWSAGCATGAEPYSVALLLRREFAVPLAGWDVTILGTDINREFLARAREARFDQWAFRATPEELRRACFRQEGKTWLLNPEHRTWVSFQYHNLVRDPYPPQAFDLILCRNVLIYFSREVARGIVSRLQESLVDGGWLLVGHAEPDVELFQAFRTTAACGETLYQKGAEEEQAEVGQALSPFLPLPAPPPPPVPEPAPADLAQVRSLADRGEWDAAAECCRRLLDTDGVNPALQFYYGLVLEQMGRVADAERALRRAVYLDRGFVLAHYHLGLLLQRRDRVRAMRSFENVLELVSRIDGARVFADGDGITAAELGELARAQLQMLAEAEDRS